MPKSPGDTLIENVSLPLAKNVLNPHFESETGTQIRAKTIDMLLALDVIASSAHDLAQVAERARNFRDQFDEKFQTTYMKQGVYDDFKDNVRTVPTGQTDEFIQTRKYHRSRNTRLSAVNSVDKGEITEVTVVNPDSTANDVHHAPFIAANYTSELEVQNNFREANMNTLQSEVHEPLRGITTIKRLGSGDNKTATSLSKSFITNPAFRGVLNEDDMKAIGDYTRKNMVMVERGSGDTDMPYLSHAAKVSEKNAERNEKKEEKRSEDAETETSEPKTPEETSNNGKTSPAGGGGAAAAPRVMVTGGGGSFGGGGGASFRGGGSRSEASFGKKRKKDADSLLDDEKGEGEIDIDKLITDMINENKATEEDPTASSLPEGSYTAVNGPDGKPMGYKVSDDLGGGVFLFDADTGESTPLTKTTKENVFMHPETGEYYQMDFPDQETEVDASVSDTDSDAPTAAPSLAEADAEKAITLTPVESDAEPAPAQVNLEELDQEFLESQGISRIEVDGTPYYAAFDKDGNIQELATTDGKLVEDAEAVIGNLEEVGREAEESEFQVPPSLDEAFGESVS